METHEETMRRTSYWARKEKEEMDRLTAEGKITEKNLTGSILDEGEEFVGYFVQLNAHLNKKEIVRYYSIDALILKAIEAIGSETPYEVKRETCDKIHYLPTIVQKHLLNYTKDISDKQEMDFINSCIKERLPKRRIP
jgi:hypothetical protein